MKKSTCTALSARRPTPISKPSTPCSPVSIAQEQKNFPDATIAVVSDHGFADIHTAVNLYIPFLQAGLIQTSTSAAGTPTVKSWLAQPWLAGGMAAIMLHDPNDTATRGKVGTAPATRR